MDQEKLKVEWVPTDRLFCNPANPRHNDDAVPHVAGSVRRSGRKEIIVPDAYPEQNAASVSPRSRSSRPWHVPSIGRS